MNMILIAKINHYFEVLIKEAGDITSGLFFFIFFRIYLSIFLLINATLWITAYYIKNIINEPRIALHYNIDSGIDYYGSDYQIFLLPLLGLFTFLTNTSVFAIVRNQQDRKFIGHILFVVAIVSNILLLIGVYSIYLINFK